MSAFEKHQFRVFREYLRTRTNAELLGLNTGEEWAEECVALEMCKHRGRAKRMNPYDVHFRIAQALVMHAQPKMNAVTMNTRALNLCRTMPY